MRPAQSRPEAGRAQSAYLFRSDQDYFPAFAKAEKTTKQNVLKYFKENEAELKTRFSEDELEDLKCGILGNGLGIKEYRI